MDWTEETISRLRSLWQEGLSTAEIGRRMSITKNAVVGKAHRRVLPPRPSPIRKPAVVGDAGAPLAARASRVTPFVPKPSPAESRMPDREPAAPTPAASTPAAFTNVTPLRAPPADLSRPEREPAPVPAASVVLREAPPVSMPAVTRPASAPSPRRHGQSCCWPLGDPGTRQLRFCGGEPMPGKPYCTEHAQLAYVKIRDRRETVA